MNTDYKKPPLAPKPKILSHLTSKLPSSLMSKPCSSARGPKPPIAPKPKLLQDSDEKCCLYTNNSLNRCSNGMLLCSEEDFNQENESDSFQITGDGYILLSDNEQLTDEGEECDNEELEETMLELCSNAVALGSSDNGEELEQDEEGGEGNLMDPVDAEGTDRMESAEISNAEYGEITEPACCGSHETLEADDELSEIAEACDNEEVNKSSEHQPHQANEDYELVDTQQGAEVDEELSQDAGNDAKREAVEECLSDNTPAINARCGIAEEDDAPGAFSQESATFYEETQDPKDEEGDLMNNNCEDLLESEEHQDNQCAVSFETSFSEKQENEISVDFASVGKQEILADQINDSSVSEAAEDSIIGNEPIADVENNLENEAKPEEKYNDNETFKVLSSEEQAPMNTTDNVSLEAIADVEEIQANIVGDTTEETIDSLQFSSEIQSPLTELMPEIEVSEPVEDASELDGSVSQEAEDLEAVECIPPEDLIEVPEADNLMEPDQDKTEVDADCTEGEGEGLSSQSINQAQNEPCAMTVPGDIDVIRIDELINRQALTDTSDIFGDDIDFEGLIVPYLEETDTDRAEDTISDEHVYEEAGLDTEGENLNFISLDRKSIVTRTRSLSGKVPGYVPETVPEETGPESDMLQSNEYCTVALDKSGNPLSDHEQLEINRMIPSKPRRFILYPRSYSVEGRDMPMSVFRENDSSTGEDGRMKRKDDNLSLPCFIGSSGSFSQRSHLPSSGMSTPTSVVDIPPPFELAYITKKPITKSSPSLLIESDSADKQKKKKSSFKRFLTLKFKKKTENKVHVDVNVSSSRSSSESSHHGPLRVLELDRRSLGSSPQLKSRSGKPWALDSPSTFLFYKDSKRKGTPKTFSRSVSRVESFEDRSRPPFMPLPLTKPRSISFPNADTSDYENIPAMNSDYENIQIPPRRPTRTGTFTEFFEDPSRALSSANENDGYVDMSSFTGFESKPQTPDQESESAYTEPYNVCPVSAVPVSGLASEEDQGKSSGEEDSLVESSQERQIDGQSRAFYIAKDLMDSENIHVKALKLLHEDFRDAVMSAVTEAGDPVLEEDKLCEILSELPQIYQFHQDILSDLEARIANWEEYQRVADVLLSRRLQFNIFTPYITQYDRNMALLEECCQKSLAFSLVVKQFEQSPACGNVSLQHQLLKVIVRILQYRMLLTDYLNNLSPDSAEYEDTQAALVIVSEVADRANDSMRKGENLLRLVHIEYSVRGQKDLLQPGRVFVKEGTLMKVSRRNRQPRHLFLMNDVMLYTYPQQDGKYRLKNTLSLTEMKVSKPIIENVHNALKIESNNCSITLSASSCGEREDWYHALSRAISDHSKGQGTFSSSNSCEAREKLWMSLGEKAPTLVPVSHVMMCMNCASDFSLTLRRHHCHACGKIVCRACSRNKYPLKYLKDRVAKVCDRCYAELKKRGGVCPGAGENSSHQSNRLSGRPLSAVFQNIHPPILWKNRKSSSALTQVAASAEGSSMSGSLHRCKRSKRTWKKLFFLIKDKVLYTFSASEDKVASESLPLLGFTVKQPEKAEGAEATMMFQLYHKKTLYYTFKAEDSYTAQRWINAMEEATVL